MAGIGFELRKLARQESLSSVVAAFGHAAVIAAGPWLFTILSLATIALLSERVVGTDALSSFRVIIIYAFAISLVCTAPISIVATRRVADALWSRHPETIRSLLLGALACALPPVAVVVSLLVYIYQVPSEIAVVLFVASMLVALIWVALSFCGAVRDYMGVTLSFLIGLVVSIIASVSAAILGLGAHGMAGGFVLGLAITFFGMVGRVLATFPHPVPSLVDGMRRVATGLFLYWPLALGALLGAVGVWIDKWVFWGSSIGEPVESGLLHAPLYDSAMFIASLGIIPSLASFVTRLETDFFERYQQYYATISSHGSYDQIEAARVRLQSYTLDNLMLVTVAQIGVSALLILGAPLIVEVLNLQFRQIAILRYGALGAIFQFIFIACSSMLLFFDRRRRFLGVQALFMVLMLAMSLLTLRLGENYHGIGYFLACLISSLVAYRVADRTFTTLNFLTFVGNNPAVIEASAQRGVRWWRPSARS